MVILLALALPTWAQNYDVSDTVTEYPQKGTYYHNKFEGRKTASGEIFDQNLFTAAHWKIKLGTYVLVTNRNTGLQVIVKVNDRCPRRGVFDMTRRAAHSIGIKGCQPVTVRLLDGDYSERCAEQDKMFDSVPSLYASGELSLTGGEAQKKPESQSSKVSSEKSRQESEKSAIGAATTNQPDSYNLILGIAPTHGEAFEMIKKVPELYQSKAIVEPVADSTLYVVLDVRLPKKKAQELNKALKHSFKECRITPSE